MSGVNIVGTSKRDNGVAGDFPIVTGQIIVSENQSFGKYALLGRITANSQGAHLDDAAIDGSESFYAVAAEACTTGAGETQTITIYKTGEFNEGELTLASGTVAAYEDAMRALSVFVRSAVPQ